MQLDYPARPLTPGEEEIMRIYEDGVYRPQDMIGRPGGFQIRRFSVRPERPVVGSAEDDPEAAYAAICRAALHRPVVSPAEEKDDPDAGDAALCQAALHSPIAGSTEVGDSLGPGEADPHRALPACDGDCP